MSKTSIYSAALKQDSKDKFKGKAKLQPEDPISIQRFETPEGLTSVNTQETPQRSWITYVILLAGIITLILLLAKKVPTPESMQQFESEVSESTKTIKPLAIEVDDKGAWDWLDQNLSVQAYFTHNGAAGNVLDAQAGQVSFAYDVRGDGSHAGLRLKNKIPDLSQYDRLSVQIVPVDGEALPTRFHMELKSAEGRVVRVLHAKDVTPLGEHFLFDLHFAKPLALSEIILSVKNKTLDTPSQTGAFRLSRLKFLPKSSQIDESV